MIKIHKYLITLLVLSIILVTSCTKSAERRIEGKWKRVIVDDVNSTKNETWDFYADGRGFIHMDADAGNGWWVPVNTNTRWVINARLRRDYIYLELDSNHIKDYNGVWEIIYIKKKTMMIVKRPNYETIYNQGHREINPDLQGGIMYREFTRLD